MSVKRAIDAVITSLLLVCCSVYSAGAAGPDSSAAKGGGLKTSTVSDTLVVTARLTELPGKMPPNDLYNYVYIMKYRVLKVEKGTLAETELLVGHYNPLIARKQIRDKMDPFVDGTVDRFTVGARHRLTLISPVERVWKDAVEDDYVDVEGTRYFALKADLLP
jgi:hypothetical protein